MYSHYFHRKKCQKRCIFTSVNIPKNTSSRTPCTYLQVPPLNASSALKNPQSKLSLAPVFRSCNKTFSCCEVHIASDVATTVGSESHLHISSIKSITTEYKLYVYTSLYCIKCIYILSYLNINTSHLCRLSSTFQEKVTENLRKPSLCLHKASLKGTFCNFLFSKINKNEQNINTSLTLCPKLSVFSVKMSTVVKWGPGRTLVYYLFVQTLPPGGECFIYIVTKSTSTRCLYSRCLRDRNNHH